MMDVGPADGSEEEQINPEGSVQPIDTKSKRAQPSG